MLFYFVFSILDFAIQFALQIKIVHDAGTVTASLPLMRDSRLYRFRGI